MYYIVQLRYKKTFRTAAERGKTSLRGKTVSFDEAILCQSPEIATQPMAARNDITINTS